MLYSLSFHIKTVTSDDAINLKNNSITNDASCKYGTLAKNKSGWGINTEDHVWLGDLYFSTAIATTYTRDGIQIQSNVIAIRELELYTSFFYGILLGGINTIVGWNRIDKDGYNSTATI